METTVEITLANWTATILLLGGLAGFIAGYLARALAA